MSAELKIFAANNAIINRYDEKLINLDFGLFISMPWYFHVADVSRPIIGADFLKKFNLLVDVKRKPLADVTTQLCAVARALQGQYSNVSVLQNNKFSQLLAQFPQLIISANLLETQPQNIIHRVITVSNPISEYPRRVPPEKTLWQKRNLTTSFSWALVSIHSYDIVKTVICTPFGLYELNGMSFELRNAAHTFQRFLDTVLRGLPFSYAYLDNVL